MFSLALMDSAGVPTGGAPEGPLAPVKPPALKARMALADLAHQSEKIRVSGERNEI